MGNFAKSKTWTIKASVVKVVKVKVVKLNFGTMITIENTQECFVQLWLQLERTRRLFADHYRRFCIRNILKEWYGARATDDFIWEVCNSIVLDDDQQVYGYDALPRPKLYPRKHREFLRALVSVVLDIGIRKVSLRDLDAAYSIAFPNSTPINVNKKKL